MGFLQHPIIPEIGGEKATGEADLGLGSTGQRRQFLQEAGDADKRGGRGSTPRKRKEGKPEWGGKMRGLGFSVGKGREVRHASQRQRSYGAGAAWLEWTEEVMGLRSAFVGGVIGKSSRNMTALKERGSLIAPMPNCTLCEKLTGEGKEKG